MIMSDTLHHSPVSSPTVVAPPFILVVRRVVRRGERKGDVRIRRDRDERGERNIFYCGPDPDTLQFGRQTAERLSLACHAMVLDIFGGPSDAPPPPGGRRWLLHSRAASSESPFPAPPQTWRTATISGLPANGADSSAPSQTAATPPRPRSNSSATSIHLFFLLLQHHRLGQPLAVSASSSCCPTS